MRGRIVKTPERVAEAQRMRGEGKTFAQIADAFGVAVQTAYQWVADPEGEDLRKRKLRYDLKCTDCGGRVNGTSPGKTLVPRCTKCANARKREHSRAWILESFNDWMDLFAVPPTATDWSPAMAYQTGQDWRADRYFATGRPWPSPTLVRDHFGSWNNGLTAAGFEPRATGCYGREGEDPELCAEIRRRYEAGEGPLSLGAEYGCTPGAIQGRVKAAGGVIRSRSEAGLLRWAREKAAA